MRKILPTHWSGTLPLLKELIVLTSATIRLIALPWLQLHLGKVRFWAIHVFEKVFQQNRHLTLWNKMNPCVFIDTWSHVSIKTHSRKCPTCTHKKYFNMRLIYCILLLLRTIFISLSACFVLRTWSLTVHIPWNIFHVAVTIIPSTFSTQIISSRGRTTSL